MPSLEAVAMVKDGETIQVAPECVAAHKQAGWKTVTGEQEQIGHALTILPDLLKRIESLEAAVQELTAGDEPAKRRGRPKAEG